MALLNLGWAKDYFWDGRALTLEEQLREPIPNPIEMNQSWEDALNKLRNTDLYPAKFAAAFGDDAITEDRAVKAMAQFLRTMVSANSKFDKWRRGEYIFTEAEFRGYELFQKEGGDPDIVQGGQFGAFLFVFACAMDFSTSKALFMKYTEGGLMLPPVSKLDIIAFLKTLTDTSFVNNPDFQNPHE